jgi:SOS-response transcriptional repressor LexA
MILTDWKRAKSVSLVDYGQVGAGRIIEFIPRGKRRVNIPQSQKTDGLVTVSVCGDSLRDLGIMDGDNLICQTKFEKSEVKNGKLVVAQLPCLGLIVKFFFQFENKIILR